MAYLPNWETVTAAPTGVFYWQTVIAGDGVWYAAAFDRGLLRSADQGATWTESTTITACEGVCASSDGAIVYAFDIIYGPGTAAGTIYKSIDHGVTFSAITETAGEPWGSLCCSEDGSKLFAAQITAYSASKILVSLDSGITWSEINFTGRLLWVSCSGDGSKVIVGHNDSSGYAYLSTDSGATFATIPDAPGQRIRACISRDGSTIYLATYFGDIIKSTDDGATWTTVLPAFDPPPIWGGIGCSADGSKVVALSLVAIHTSEDAGSSWFKVYEDGFASFTCNITRALSPDNSIVLIGDEGSQKKLLKGFFLTNPDLSCCCTKWLTQYFPGQPTTEQRMAYFAIPLAVTVPQGFAGSKAVCVTGPDAAITYSINDASDYEVGTITFATGETTGTFTGPSALALAAGDTLSVIAPSAPDTNQADIAITLVAVCEGNDPPAPSACCNTIRVDMTATATFGVRLTNIPRPRVRFDARAVMMGRLTNA